MEFIKDDIIKEIIDFLKRYESIQDVILFGSRARGDFSELSDFDIAISGNLDNDSIIEITTFLNEEINTLKKIDVIFLQYDSISSELRKNIQKEGVSLW